MTDLGSPFGQVVAAAARPVVEFPTGTVTAVSATTLNVNVRGTTIRAAYLAGYAAQVGDLVVLGRNDATWIVLDRLGGVGTNQVLNPSFEADGVLIGVPSSWFQAVLAGAPTVSEVVTGYAVDGQLEAVVTAGAAAQDSYLYSSPIAVVPGQSWALSAFAAGVYPVGAPQNATAGLYGLWFADDVSLYPTTSAPDTLVGQAVNLSAAPTHASVSGQVMVPAATTYMRVALRSVSPAAVSIAWDLVTARRIG